MLRAMCVWAVLAGSAAAQQAADDKKPAPATDLQFLVDASVLIHAGVQYSQLADKDRAGAGVQKFAAEVMESHKEMHKQLAATVKNRNVGVVAGTEKQTRQERARLEELKGDAFDRAYLARMIADHQQLIRMCENQVKSGKDEELTGFAKEVLPGLRKHLERAQELTGKN